jgi:sugar/nucleoside kinase (ribokinase family)
MKYLVIGEPCVDLIHRADGDVIHSYGGILYSAISLAVLSSKGDVVYPLMNLGSDEYANIIEIFRRYPNINTGGINKVAHPTRKVNLYYNNYNSGKSARLEHSTEPTYTLDFEPIEKFLKGADGILVNMISGVDITLDTFKKIRDKFSGFMHIDIHNLVMKTNEDGSREHTNLPEWRDWCGVPTTLQMNEFEIASLSRTIKNEYEIAEEILMNKENHTEGVIITRGKIGVSGFRKKEKVFAGEKFFDLDKEDVLALESPHFADSTGCGDVFAASFTMEFSKSRNFRKSLNFATRTASINTSLEGINELYKLK